MVDGVVKNVEDLKETKTAMQGGAWGADPRKMKKEAHWCRDCTESAYHKM